MKQIDERGNACPIPVVHTKKALESMNGETKLVVLVDNEPAVQNVKRFAEGKNCEVKSEKISDNEFKIEIMVENYTPADEEEEIVCAPSAKDDFIIVVSSNEMGQGEKALGQTLIKAFLFAVTKQDKLPSKMLVGACCQCCGLGRKVGVRQVSVRPRMNKIMSLGAKPEEPEASTTKICPFCMSEIDIRATRCPHCTSVQPEEDKS